MTWRPIPSAPGYEVSADGLIRSVQRGKPKVLKTYPDEHGYHYFRRCYGRRRTWRSVHGAVAEAFLGPRPDGHQVRHLNGDPANNTLTNISYGSVSENVRDQVRHGTHAHAAKTHCHKGHPFDEANTYTWRGRRHCRACNRENVARVRERKQVAA